MRKLAVLVGGVLSPVLLWAGCATDNGQRAEDVRIVGKLPPGHYESVGRVTGVAANTDFVAAADDARASIRVQAAQQGATVVKLETVRVPPETKPGEVSDGSHAPRVLLVGHAYRPVPARVRRHRPRG